MHRMEVLQDGGLQTSPSTRREVANFSFEIPTIPIPKPRIHLLKKHHAGIRHRE